VTLVDQPHRAQSISQDGELPSNIQHLRIDGVEIETGIR
jgi:hypothetical protein